MTIAVCTPLNSYIGNDTTATYPFTFPVWNSSQFIVTVAPTTPGMSYQLTSGVDYNVTGLNAAGTPASTGNIVLINASQAWIYASGFLKTGWVLTIVRTLTLTQNTSIRNQASYYPETLEDALDYLTMCEQDQAAGVFIVTDQVTQQQYLMVMINGVFSQIPIA
jgi:hypothetical protein